MAILEWIGAHLIGPLVNLWRGINARPRPDLRVLSVSPRGGSDYPYRHVDFSVELANYGTQQCRCEVRASIDGEEAECLPRTLDLSPNAPPERVRVLVKRPDLGELMEEAGHTTTLYGRTLHVRATAGKHRAECAWQENIYSPDTDRARYEIQQKYWRQGRGEETADDRRADALAAHEKRVDEEGEGRRKRRRRTYPT